MPASVEIDSRSGFCGGVIRAISSAEKYLDGKEGEHLFSLGAIVHNEEELDRLARKGLVCIDLQDLQDMKAAEGEMLLIRAHGEPPTTYDRAKELGFNIIDCTCPVVLKLQNSIKEAYARLHENGGDGQIVLFGKVGHAEVLGLVGQVKGDAIIVENMSQLDAMLQDGTIRIDVATEVFSQTTKSPVEYSEICDRLRNTMEHPDQLSVHDTICSQVASRHEALAEFAREHDVIIFVSGKSSSNGRVLSELCKSVNIRTYHVCSESEIRPEWFREEDRVGICGATSTPLWLLESVAAHVAAL